MDELPQLMTNIFMLYRGMLCEARSGGRTAECARRLPPAKLRLFFLVEKLAAAFFRRLPRRPAVPAACCRLYAAVTENPPLRAGMCGPRRRSARQLGGRSRAGRCCRYFPAAAFAAMAWLAVMAIILYTSSMLQPRDRSLTGRAMPWRMGPTAVAWPRRCTSL